MGKKKRKLMQHFTGHNPPKAREKLSNAPNAAVTQETALGDMTDKTTQDIDGQTWCTSFSIREKTSTKRRMTHK